MTTEQPANPTYYGTVTPGGVGVPATFQPGPVQAVQQAIEEVVPKLQELPLGTVEGILAAPDIATETMPIPEWGCSIRVRGLTKIQQQAIRKEAARGQRNNEPDSDRIEMLMFLTGVVEPKFERGHYPQLMEKNSGVLDRVLQRIAKLSGADPEAIARAMQQFQD